MRSCGESKFVVLALLGAAAAPRIGAFAFVATQRIMGSHAGRSLRCRTFSQRARPALQASSAPPKGGGKGAGVRRGKVDPVLQKALDKYQPVIGVEVHVQLSSKTKAYCRCATAYSPSTPNTNVCPVCMGEPGALPVPNAQVVELAAKAGLAMGCRVAEETKWDRKNYFYPDTPKNYQITQYDRPIAQGGAVELPSGQRVRIQRLHMEEDSAKMNHQGAGALAGSTHSLVDFNRAGTPLAEIVSEPDMHSGAEAAEYGRELQRILRYVGASDGNMAEGSLRLDINVSLRPHGSEELRTKVELKNLNSFKSVQESVDFEVVRQAAAYDAGEKIRQETRLWDEKERVTKIMRVKEGEADYRYFPEPDIPPLRLAPAQIEAWRRELPELPAAKRARYAGKLKLPAEDARTLTDDVAVAEYFEAAVAAGADPVEACKWVIGDVAAYLKNAKQTVAETPLDPKRLAELVSLIGAKKMTGKIAKELLPELLDGSWKGGVAELAAARGMEVISDPAQLEALVREVMDANADKVEQYRSGKVKLAGFFVGQVMTKSGSRADPEAAQAITKRLLDGE